MFSLSDEEFKHFVDIHSSKIHDSSIMKVEDNTMMKSSYLLLDEYGRFLDSSLGSKIPTESVLDVGITEAYKQLLGSSGGGFDSNMFIKRDGLYEKSGWTR